MNCLPPHTVYRAAQSMDLLLFNFIFFKPENPERRCCLYVFEGLLSKEENNVIKINLNLKN